MYNPMQINNNDPENTKYTLFAEFINDDNEGTVYKDWMDFDSRGELYKYIKDNLDCEDSTIPMININTSFVLMNHEIYLPNERRSVSVFMTVVSPLYGDNFNPSNYEINYEN